MEQKAETVEDVKTIARRLVGDESYQKALLERMRDGDAGPMEPLLWRYAHGDPRIHHKAVEDEAKFERIRAAVKAFRIKEPDRAKLLDMALQAAAVEPIDVDPEPEQP